MINKINKFFIITPSERKIFLEAIFFLSTSCLLIKIIPFRYLSTLLNFNEANKISENQVCDMAAIEQVSKSIQRAVNNLPWKSVCLPQAITAKLMLRRRKTSSILYLGLEKKEEGRLGAHAWLRAGNSVVTGGVGKDNFTVVASFT